MRTEEPVPLRLQDYKPVDYKIEQVELEFNLDPQRTIVKSRLHIMRNTSEQPAQPLRLHGEKLSLRKVCIDDKQLDQAAFDTDDNGLTIYQVPERFTLDIETEIDPKANTALEGLYMSNGMFCTQCEAEGFRRITYYLDRPDVMAVFRTRIIASKEEYPVLLSNGNIVDQGELDNDRHWVEWHDPFPKPSYLFALVGGNLACVEDQYKTVSGRDVSLKIFVEPGDENRCEYAMDALKRSMKWDEATYGREYDLDTFMIVAVSHFNMGAMENKGLNIFNSQYILARPETATDLDYSLIESIIAHEYFHNWTGNRITCRDWFQLCLKEGLTVFRDQQFSADMRSEAVQRIKDVRMLRFRQFTEDAGPLAHPVRPDTYFKIDNFYTATVYEKGAEAIRMLRLVLGVDGFRQGMDLYFERHDGQAVTIEDFLNCMAEANQTDLSQFKLWYTQIGTPIVSVETEFDEATSRFSIHLKQSFEHEKAIEQNKPSVIPVKLGLLNDAGQDLPLNLQNQTLTDQSVMFLTEAEQTFTFDGIESEPHISLFRNFSAPIKLEQSLTQAERAFLIAHDTDPFNRWENTQLFAQEIIFEAIDQIKAGKTPSSNESFIQALGQLIQTTTLEPSFVAETLVLPSEIDLARDLTIVEPDLIHQARNHIIEQVSLGLKDVLLDTYKNTKCNGPYSSDIEQAGPRALKNAALHLLVQTKSEDFITLAQKQFYDAENMTDRMAALTAVNDLSHPIRDEILNSFYDQWCKDELVVNKWLRLEAISSRPTTYERVKSLLEHEAFELSNPNKVRALIGTFSLLNQVRFHDLSGAGYALFTDIIILLDRLNPQTAARLTSAFENWRRFDQIRQDLMQSQIKRIVSRNDASENVTEIATKILGESALTA